MKNISKVDKLRLEKLTMITKILTDLEISIFYDKVNYDDTIAVELNERITSVINRIDEIAEIVGTPTNKQGKK
jgi:hypothetical protein